VGGGGVGWGGGGGRHFKPLPEDRASLAEPESRGSSQIFQELLQIVCCVRVCDNGRFVITILVS